MRLRKVMLLRVKGSNKSDIRASPFILRRGLMKGAAIHLVSPPYQIGQAQTYPHGIGSTTQSPKFHRHGDRPSASWRNRG